MGKNGTAGGTAALGTRPGRPRESGLHPVLLPDRHPPRSQGAQPHSRHLALLPTAGIMACPSRLSSAAVTARALLPAALAHCWDEATPGGASPRALSQEACGGHSDGQCPAPPGPCCLLLCCLASRHAKVPTLSAQRGWSWSPACGPGLGPRSTLASLSPGPARASPRLEPPELPRSVPGADWLPPPPLLPALRLGVCWGRRGGGVCRGQWGLQGSSHGRPESLRRRL